MKITKLDIIKSHIQNLKSLKENSNQNKIWIENMICDMKTLEQMEGNR